MTFTYTAIADKETHMWANRYYKRWNVKFTGVVKGDINATATGFGKIISMGLNITSGGTNSSRLQWEGNDGVSSNGTVVHPGTLGFTAVGAGTRGKIWCIGEVSR